MSSLNKVTELLEKDCFCHSAEIKYIFECMPPSIAQRLESECDNSYCFHKPAPKIKASLQKFKTFMERESRFKVGDRVELARTPVINATESWGWLSSRHYLIEGSQATVAAISYYSNTFGYSIVFDEESWIDEKNVIHPRTGNDKHCYYFREHDLRPVGGNRPCEFLKKLWSDFYKIGD